MGPNSLKKFPMRNLPATVRPLLPREHRTALRRSRSEGSGFALVIALGLMAFVLLLLVSMTALVRVETSAAATATETLKARQNALLAMRVALGDLQRYAGPDQRVTATASVFPDADASREHMTGVWMADENAGDHGERLEWLVSGDNPTPTSADWPTLVEAIAESSPGAGDGAAAVRAAPIEVEEAGGGVSGEIAWWVGDEGAKASSALAPPDDPMSQHRRLLGAYDFSLPLMEGMDAVTDPGIWARAERRESVPLLADTSTFRDAVKARFHDFTPRSLGVLADVRNGGLKRDLTAGLQPGSTAMEDDTGEAALFGPQWGGPQDEDPGGPLWEQLRSFYNTRVSADSGPGEIAFQKGSDSQVSVAPVLTLGQVYLHALKGDADGNTIRFYALPAFALWNPYQHRLSMPDFFVTWDHRSDKSWWRVRNGAGEDLAAFAFHDSGPPRWRIPETVWAPGEVKLFSMGEHSRYPGNPAADPESVTLTEGFFDGFGSYWEKANGGVLDGDLILRRDLFSRQKFLLSTGAANPENSAFMRVLRQDHTNVPASGNYGARNILYYESADADAMAVPPPDDQPLIDPTHGTHVPAMGYRSTMKFAKWQGESTWIDQMGFVVDKMGHHEVPFLAHYNPRATFSGYHKRRRPYWNNPLYASGYMRQFDYNDASNYATGFSPFLSGGGITNAAYFEFAREGAPFLSIGQLAMAGLSRTNDFQDEASGALYNNYQPAFAIGNSLADPRIENDATFRNWREIGRNGTHYDLSHLLNEALWDRYFFSAVPRTGAIDADAPSANPRLVSAGSAEDETYRDYRDAASALMLEGAFNVNSTSVEAWKSLLGTFWKEAVPTGAGDEANEAFAPLPRYYEPIRKAFDGSGSDDHLSTPAYLGYRRLGTEAAGTDEVGELATAIVEGIRDRSGSRGRPFLGLADFVNRSPEASESDHRLRGLLQEAIDEAGLNDALSGGALTLEFDSGSEKSYYEDGNGLVAENAEADYLFGVPGYLTQADILAKIGPLLSARSDTFLVRAYGQAAGSVEGSGAEAWCEVKLQRIIEPVDAPAPGAEDYEERTRKADGPFGRRFVVTGFRWLSEEEL